MSKKEATLKLGSHSILGKYEIKTKKIGYAQRVLDTGQEYGKLEDTMEITEIQHKGSHLNTM
jgi:hypothetical protein